MRFPSSGCKVDSGVKAGVPVLIDRKEMEKGLWLFVAQDIIFRTLIELHQLKGEEGDKWLSDFEAELIRDTKDLVPQGLGMEDEIAGYESMIGYIQYLFGGVRRKIAKKPEGQ